MRIRSVDLETCGIEPPAGVVEIGAWDLDTETGEVWPWLNTMVDPGQTIPPEMSAIHHITDEEVEGAPSFAEAIGRALIDADALCAHHASFERRWITDEMTGGRPWICTLRCAYRTWPEAPGHSNQTLRYWLKPEGLDRDIAKVAHRAGPDAYVTAFLLRELLKKASVADLITWSGEPALLPRLTFGKHKGQAWRDVPVDYLSWLTRQADMSEDVRHTARHWLRQVA